MSEWKCSPRLHHRGNTTPSSSRSLFIQRCLMGLIMQQDKFISISLYAACLRLFSLCPCFSALQPPLTVRMRTPTGLLNARLCKPPSALFLHTPPHAPTLLCALIWICHFPFVSSLMSLFSIFPSHLQSPRLTSQILSTAHVHLGF